MPPLAAQIDFGIFGLGKSRRNGKPVKMGQGPHFKKAGFPHLRKFVRETDTLCLLRIKLSRYYPIVVLYHRNVTL